MTSEKRLRHVAAALRQAATLLRDVSVMAGALPRADREHLDRWATDLEGDAARALKWVGYCDSVLREARARRRAAP